MTIDTRLANYHNAQDCAALLTLLNAYASDPAGGGTPLSDFAQVNLIAALQTRPSAFSILAIDTVTQEAIGLVNSFEGFSTFACAPLVNIHDVYVQPAYRGRGITALMLRAVEAEARLRGACKLTLEVLQGNTTAHRSYTRFGFAGYALDPAFGEAVFLQKGLA